MDLKYYYLDETYKKVGNYWHSIIGGVIVSPEIVAKINQKVNHSLTFEIFNGNGGAGLAEFKYCDFFTDQSDDVKICILKKIIGIVREYDIHFLLSHAFIKEGKIKSFGSFGKNGDEMIQSLAFSNVSTIIQYIIKYNFLQLVIDAGFSESFRRIYDMYMGLKRGVDNAKAAGFSDKEITIKNYERILTPLFVDSKDERLIQISDFILGNEMAKIQPKKSLYRTLVNENMQELKANIQVLSVEWNK